jgi:hypothetical protein
MRWAGVAALTVAVGVLSACGAVETRQGATADELRPAPPIEAIDEPASSRFFFPPEFLKDGTPVKAEVCRFLAERSGNLGSGSENCEPTPEELVAFRKFNWEDRPELVPPEGSELRSIARLALQERGPKDLAILATWRSTTGRLCLDTDIIDFEGLQGGSAFGPCLTGSRCTQVCLDRSGHYDYDTPPWLLSGIVSAKAEELRIVFPNGRAARYPLTGPTVPGFPDRRVFMVDLGRESHRRLELLIGGEAVAYRDEWPRQIAIDNCILTYKWPQQEQEFNQCLDKAWAEGVEPE